MVRQVQAPLEMATIKHGKFLHQVNAQIKKGQDELIAFVLANPAAAKGAKSQVSLKITLVCGGGEQGMETYILKAQSKLSVPDSPPAVASLDLQESAGGDGELELMIPFNENYQEERQGVLPINIDKAV